MIPKIYCFDRLRQTSKQKPEYIIVNEYKKKYGVKLGFILYIIVAVCTLRKSGINNIAEKVKYMACKTYSEISYKIMKAKIQKKRKNIQNDSLFKNKTKAVLPYIEYHISDHCNLNCKGCVHFCNIEYAAHS